MLTVQYSCCITLLSTRSLHNALCPPQLPRSHALRTNYNSMYFFVDGAYEVVHYTSGSQECTDLTVSYVEARAVRNISRNVAAIFAVAQAIDKSATYRSVDKSIPGAHTITVVRRVE